LNRFRFADDVIFLFEEVNFSFEMVSPATTVSINNLPSLGAERLWFVPLLNYQFFVSLPFDAFYFLDFPKDFKY
jgi:hypothetical protein